MSRYHLIRSDDMLNGDGLRVILFLSGCEHHCKGCHNPETWDINSGKELNFSTVSAICNELEKEYISGLTLSGGDPLHESNILDVFGLVNVVKSKYPDKTIWIYTGYTWEEVYTKCPKTYTEHFRNKIIESCDVLVDGKFVKDLADVNCPWVGSTNQRVIDIKNTLRKNKIQIYKEV